MPTPIDKQMDQTVQTIEKALEDIKNNKATKQEVIDLIADRTKADKEALTAAQKQIGEVKSQADELKAAADTLKSQLRQLQENSYAVLKDNNGNYRGSFRSVEEARQLGLIMMGASMTAGVQQFPEIAAKHARIMKALETSGRELVFIEDKTGKRIEKAATTGSQSGGSLLVTTEMAPGLIMLLEQYGKFRANAGIVPMGANSTFTPKLDTMLTFYVPGEGVAPTVTDPTIGGITLVPKTLTALAAYSMELDEDSAVAMAELYGNLFARSAAYYEDICGFLGDGTSTYFGFRGITGALRAVDAAISSIKSLVVGSGNAYSELVYGDIEAVIGTLPDYADPKAKWYMHRYFYYTVAVRAALAAGTGHAQEVLLGTAQRQKMVGGYPVEFVQVLPKAEANSQICAIFGDLSLGCQFGTRGVMEFAQSDQRYFDQGLIALRCRERIAINAHGVGDTTKAGPMIGLITAAS